MTAREELKRAQAAQAAAHASLEAARAATSRARSLLESVVRESEDHETGERRASSSLVADMKNSLMSGSARSATASDQEMAKNASIRATLDLQRQAAEQVIAELVEEERERERESSAATAAVVQAIQGVLRDEAEKIALVFADMDLKARAVRIRLAGNYDSVRHLSGLSDNVRRTIDRNHQDQEFDNAQSQIINARWSQFATQLTGNPEARLDFTAAEREIAEITKARAERKAADERFHSATAV